MSAIWKWAWEGPLFLEAVVPDREEVIQRVETLAEPVLRSEGLDLVEVQYRRERSGWVLRLFIDRRPAGEQSGGEGPLGSGVTLDDCTAVSQELGPLLEVEDFIPGAYTLEVSSPGLDRPLKKPADFERFAGRPVRVKTGRRKIRGRLLGLEAGVIRLEVEGGVVEVGLEETRRVELEPVVDWARV